MPQSIDNNRYFRDGASAWANLEKFESNKMVSELGYELYNFAGGIGNKLDDEQWDGEVASRATVNYGKGETEEKTRPSNLLKAGIDIPEWTWKIVLGLQPGQGVEDVTVDTPIIAVMTPNIAEPERFYPPFGNPSQRVIHPLYPSRSINRDEWRNWQTWQVSIDMIEEETGFDFFSELPDEIETVLERDITNLLESDLRPITDLPLFPDLPNDDEDNNSDLSLQAPLLVEPQETVNLPVVVSGVDNSSVFQSQMYNSTSEIDGIYIFSSSQVGTKYIANSDFRAKQVSPSHISTLQLSTLQKGFGQVGSTQISIGEIALVQISTGQVGIAQVGSFQIDPPQVSLSQIGTTEINTAQIGSNSLAVGFVISPNVKINTDSTKVSSFEIDSAKISLPSSITLQQFLSSHNSPFEISNTYKDNPLNFWQTLFDPTFNINFQIADLPTGQLAEAQLTQYDQQGRPNGGTILIDHNANGLGWFIDQTPWENSEFSQTLADTAFRATTGEAAGKYDLLTTILHEMGHLAGIINGNPEFDKRIQTINGTRSFVGNNFTATLTNDGSHLDSRVHQYDLMNNSLAPGMRKLPSWLNLQMLNAIRNTTVAPSSITQLTAPLTAILLADITNGNFIETNTSKPEYGWTTRGAATILDQEAVLTEDSPFNSNFSQSFIIPEGAKYLQFTLKNTTLGANTPTSPGDAFEVALLNANTKASLLNTVTGLTQTDSFLNIQNDGTYYSNDKVKLINTNPNNKLTLNQPLTFKIDLTGIQAGTAATLYFDLLGFGTRDAKVVVDDVILLDNDFIAPTANNDTATTNQTQPVTYADNGTYLATKRLNLLLFISIIK